MTITGIYQNTHDWSKDLQPSVDLLSSLDGNVETISVTDIYLTSGSNCETLLGKTAVNPVAKIVCQDPKAFTNEILNEKFQALNGLRMTLSADNIVREFLRLDRPNIKPEVAEFANAALPNLEAIVLRVKDRLLEQPNLSPQEKVKLVFTVLWEMGYIIEENKDLLSEGLLHHRLDCDIASYILLAVGEELNWPLSLVLMPGHAFVRYDDGKLRFNIDQGEIVPEDSYRARLHKTALAKSIYLKSLSRQEAFALYYAVISSRLTELHDYDQALHFLFKALAILPNEPSIMRHTAVVLTFKYGSSAGKPWAIKALEYDPADMGALSLLISFSIEENNLPLAKRYFNQARNALDYANDTRDMAQFLYASGYISLEEGKCDLAEAAFQRLLLFDTKIDPMFNAYRGLSTASSCRGDIPEAIERQKKAIRMGATDAESFSDLGNLYRLVGNYPEAKKAYYLALSLKPNDTLIKERIDICAQEERRTANIDGIADIYEVALTAVNNSDWEAAKEALLKVAAVNPDYRRTQFQLGLAEYYLDNNAAARDYFLKAFALDPDDAKIPFNLALCNKYLGQKGKTLGDYIVAAKLDPKNAEIWYRMAKLYWDLDQWEAAVMASAEACNLEPGNDDYCDLAKEIREEGNSPLYNFFQ